MRPPRQVRTAAQVDTRTSSGPPDASVHAPRCHTTLVPYHPRPFLPTRPQDKRAADEQEKAVNADATKIARETEEANAIAQQASGRTPPAAARPMHDS